MDPTPYSSKYLGSGITDIGFLCGLVCFIQFMLDVFCECRVLFNTHDNHRSITVFSKENRCVRINNSLFNLRKLISKIRHRVNINHNATFFLSLFYHNFTHSFHFAQGTKRYENVSLNLFFIYNSSCRELGIIQITER